MLVAMPPNHSAGIRRRVAAAADLIARADSEWRAGAEDEKIVDDQYLAHLVRVAYYSTLALLDLEGLSALRSEVRRSWRLHEGDLLRGEEVHALGESRLASTEPLREVVDALQRIEGAASNIAFEPSFEHAVRILRNLRSSAFRLGMTVKDEADLDTLCETLLLATFPDLNRNPTVNLANSYRAPDSAIPSIETLLEYKYLSKKGNPSTLVDEIQADVRNYAAKGFSRFIVFVGQAEAVLHEDNVRRDVTAEPSSFTHIEVIVDRV